MNIDTVVELLRRGQIGLNETDSGWQVTQGGEVIATGDTQEEALLAAAWRYASPVINAAGKELCSALVRRLLNNG